MQSEADGSIRMPEDEPFIAVYTDSSTTRDVGTPLRAMAVNGATDIIFEAGIASTMTTSDPDTDESMIVGVGLPPTDGAMEFYLDMVMRDIDDVLTDPDNVWSQLYQGFISAVGLVERRRAGSDSAGQRVAGQQLKVSATLLADPIRGDALRATSVMARFLAQVETINDARLCAQADMIVARLSGSAEAWKIVQRRYGLTRDESEALGISPTGDNEISITGVEVASATTVQDQ
jgi:hypothetical protein